jgi:outer membrane receptor for ferrienterochelin and colicin
MHYASRLLLAAITFAALPAAARQITINGYIKERGSNERLIGAIAAAPALGAGASTNNFGFYSLSVPEADSVQLVFSYVGHNSVSLTVPAHGDTAVNVTLQVATALSDVTVRAASNAIQDRTQMSAIDLPIQTIKSLPAFLGEVDVLKAIQLLPGIQSGNEGSTGLYVRGGSPDQNLILLDGVPVYNASHLFGFFSVFNADAIKSVNVIKGGFPARYGGRLSSVIDINMKDGDQNKYHAEGGIGLIASRLTLEGPIQKGKSSFMISGRRTYIDVLTKPFMSKDFKAGYYFYDLNAKVNFTLGPKDNIYISGYGGNDKFSVTEEYGSNSKYNFTSALNWGNITAVARWNHQFSPRLFGNLTTYYSQYRFGVSTEQKDEYNGQDERYLLKYRSGINDKALRYDLEFTPSIRHAIRTGVSAVAHTYTPSAMQTKITGTSNPTDTTEGDPVIKGTELDAYIEDEIRISDRLKGNFGLHWTGFSVGASFFNYLQPRASLRYKINDQMSAKASYVQMAQFIHLLTNSSIGLPTDLWLPATDRVKPQRSWQAAVGLAYTHKSGIELSVEGYYKQMDGVIEYKEGASFLGRSTGWEDKVLIGMGSSYGAELFLQKTKGRFTGMAGYTLSWTNRKFDELNNGAPFPYRYDRRHDIKLAAVFRVTPGIELSADWVYGTGNAITIPIGSFTGPSGQEMEIYGPRNGYRMAPYHRGDISARFIKQMKRHERAWVIGVYNVYNRKNPFFIYRDGAQFKQVSLFPIIPSISYQFKF